MKLTGKTCRGMFFFFLDGRMFFPEPRVLIWFHLNISPQLCLILAPWAIPAEPTPLPDANSHRQTHLFRGMWPFSHLQYNEIAYSILPPHILQNSILHTSAGVIWPASGDRGRKCLELRNLFVICLGVEERRCVLLRPGCSGTTCPL